MSSKPIDGVSQYSAIMAHVDASLDPESPNGMGGLILNSKSGSSYHANRWDYGELTQLVDMIKTLDKSGKVTDLSRDQLNDLLGKLNDVFAEVGPVRDAGLGASGWRLKDLEGLFDDLRATWIENAKAAAQRNRPVDNPGPMPAAPKK